MGPGAILDYWSFSFKFLLRKVEHISCSFGFSLDFKIFLGLHKIMTQKWFLRHHFIRITIFSNKK